MLNKTKIRSFITIGLITSLSCATIFPNKGCYSGFLNNSLTKNLGDVSMKKMGFYALGTVATALALFGFVKAANLYSKKHESRLDFGFSGLNFEAKDLKNLNGFRDGQKFLWGVATSAYQVEGRAGYNEDNAGKPDAMPRNQWEALEGKNLEIGGKSVMPVPHISGNACKHWEMYKQDIDLAKKLGFTTFRISIAWEKVEPKCGEFDQKALQHYKDVCEYMVQNGIKPLITLHHYTDPVWFAEKGGFEKEENIKYFVEFCQKVFEILNKNFKPLWFTFNTFEGYAMPGYSQAEKPPFKKDMKLAINVLKNLLEAHVQVYRALKQIDSDSKIGIYKNIHQIDPWNLLNPFDRLMSYFAEYLTNTVIYNFFKTGVFKVKIPFKVDINYINKDAVQALDMVGLNYYSGKFAKNFAIITRPGCKKTQNPAHCVYPEGFYRAIKSISKDFAEPLNIPIYVTENGIAALSDIDRQDFYKNYLFALDKAVGEGADVRGYVTWTLMDNYEWIFGYNVKYGICSVDPGTMERKLKPGTDFLLEVVQNNKRTKEKIICQ